MHISHDFIATKTCPSYECLVVFGQVRVWDRKSEGWTRVRMVCGAGRVRAKFLKLLRVWGGFKFCGCGAGADTKFQPAQDSTVVQIQCTIAFHAQTEGKVSVTPKSW